MFWLTQGYGVGTYIGGESSQYRNLDYMENISLTNRISEIKRVLFSRQFDYS